VNQAIAHLGDWERAAQCVAQTVPQNGLPWSAIGDVTPFEQLVHLTSYFFVTKVRWQCGGGVFMKSIHDGVFFGFDEEHTGIIIPRIAIRLHTKGHLQQGLASVSHCRP